MELNLFVNLAFKFSPLNSLWNIYYLWIIFWFLKKSVLTNYLEAFPLFPVFTSLVICVAELISLVKKWVPQSSSLYRYSQAWLDTNHWWNFLNLLLPRLHSSLQSESLGTGSPPPHKSISLKALLSFHFVFHFLCCAKTFKFN